MKANIEVDIDTENLAEALVDDLTNDDLIDFIKQVDEAAQDWDFTNEVYEYFKKQHEEFLDIEDDDEMDIDPDDDIDDDVFSAIDKNDCFEA